MAQRGREPRPYIVPGPAPALWRSHRLSRQRVPYGAFRELTGPPEHLSADRRPAMQTHALEAVTRRPSVAGTRPWLKRLAAAVVGVPLASYLAFAIGLSIAYSPTYAWR